MRWKIGQSFHHQLCQKYRCQKLLKSDNFSSSYNRKCPVCFSGHSVHAYDIEFQTERALTLNAFADNAIAPF